MKTKTLLSRHNRHFGKVCEQKPNWCTNKEFRIMKFVAGSQRDIKNRTGFLGKLKRSKMSVPKSNYSKCKITEEGRDFNERRTNDYFFVPNKNKATCLICNEVITQKEYNVKRHFISCYKEFKQLSGEVHNQKITTLKRNLSHQQSVFVNLQDVSCESKFLRGSVYRGEWQTLYRS